MLQEFDVSFVGRHECMNFSHVKRIEIVQSYIHDRYWNNLPRRILVRDILSHK